MNLDSRPAFRLAPVITLEPQTEFPMPHGTVTVVIDRARGILDIFAEHECDPLDWELTCGLLARMGLNGDLPRGEYLKGVDTWRVQLGKHRQAS